MKDQIPKTLLLVRHAHRDNSQPSKDNSLTEKGRAQAETLLKSLRENGFPLEDIELISSPKKRCIETLHPLSKAYGKKINPDLLLLERSEDESLSKFKKRILGFLEKWRVDSSPFVLLCSHGDWLPIAVELLGGGSVEFKKGGWAEINLTNDKPTVVFRN